MVWVENEFSGIISIPGCVSFFSRLRDDVRWCRFRGVELSKSGLEGRGCWVHEAGVCVWIICRVRGRGVGREVWQLYET